MTSKQSETNENKPLFQVFLLKNNKALGVEIDEVKRIDFEMVTRRLKLGESVFIAQKRPRERKLNKSLFDEKKSWYLAHL